MHVAIRARNFFVQFLYKIWIPRVAQKAPVLRCFGQVWSIESRKLHVLKRFLGPWSLVGWSWYAEHVPLCDITFLYICCKLKQFSSRSMRCPNRPFNSASPELALDAQDDLEWPDGQVHRLRQRRVWRRSQAPLLQQCSCWGGSLRSLT